MSNLKIITASHVNRSNARSKDQTADSANKDCTPRTSLSRSVARTAVLTSLIGLSLSAIASGPANRSANPKSTQTKPHSWFQIGKASWYGGKFQGHKTANGERFDMHELTCAHRTLPLGTWVRITNLRNHRAVFVRVNDRGPMLEDRIVDLSYAAARAVGISGLTRVKVEPVRPDDPQMAKELTAQLQMPSPLISMGR